MPYHVSTLLGPNVVHAKAYLTKNEAEKEAERKALRLAGDNLRLQEEHAEKLQRAVLDGEPEEDDETSLAPFPYLYTYRVDRCANSHLCLACLEAGFDDPVKWPRRGTAWNIFDHDTHIEIQRTADCQVFAEDEGAASFVVMAAQSPGTPEDIRRECQMALGEVLYCNSMGIETWRAEYAGLDRWREILGFDLEDDDDPPCACLGSGFLVMNEERYEPEALGEIQTCDCGILKTDDDAIEAARASGYTVTDEGLITSEPCRMRARRRWGA